MLEEFITDQQLTRLIEIARDEDLGPRRLDMTSEICVPADAHDSASIVARQDGVLAGAALLPIVASVYDQDIKIEQMIEDGSLVKAGGVIAKINGPRKSILTMERVALNLMTHLCGIATLTRRYVAKVQGTQAKICDTRKTLPGLRALEKYGVHCGGGVNHRMGLYDAVLIKDNHLAHIPVDDLTEALSDAVQKARNFQPAPSFIQVEVDTLGQLEQILKLDIDIALLDNMAPDTLRRAVTMRNEVAPRIKLEASGGINLQTVGAVAESGVDRISVGALTHSAPSLDLGLDI